MQTKFNIISLLLLTFAAFLFPSFVYAQTLDSTTVKIRKIDFRGQRAQKAFVAAHSASKKDVVVVMLRGADQELIEQTEQNMKGLVQNGYERIGLVISDLLPEDKSPTIAIISQGYTYASIKEATISAKTSLHFYQLMRDVYKEDILSQLD